MAWGNGSALAGKRRMPARQRKMHDPPSQRNLEDHQFVIRVDKASKGLDLSASCHREFILAF
jgi:hypothetical protein